MPRLVSLFSGCGGMDKGFELAGFDRVWANDFDKDAQAVFRLNLGEIDGRDIREVSVDDIPDCDILTAGFPCQPFSNAGNRKGVYDSRGELYLECLRIIEHKHPRVVLFENVKGLLSSKHQNGKKLIEVIEEDLERLGYIVNYDVVNASDYGVPQNRERMILVAVDQVYGRAFVFPEKIQDKTHLTLRHILDIPADVPNQVDWPLSPQALGMIEQIPEGGSWKSIPYENLSERFKKIRDNMVRYHSPNFYRRFSREEINGTITASAQPENCGIVHPIHNRRYTIREIARIQTFPDDFIFIDDSLKNITAMYKVIGNAVPVHLAEVIAEAIMNQFFYSLGGASMMNTDKAYIIGLVVGGGSFGSSKDSFSIKLPYKQWGDVSKNPTRAGEIANDIIKAVSPVMKSEYGLTVAFETSPEWRIVCTGTLTAIINDLKSYGIPPVMEIRKNADISNLVPALVDDNLKRRFVAGLADTIGSMASSHRRFNDDVQIISFEINGFAFKFVNQLCKLLYELGCLPDQVVWQQPNMQSGNDSYYTQWKKGNKLRVTLDAFSKFGALGFRSKAIASKENRAKQSKTNFAEKCETKTITLNGVTAVHIDENHRGLPAEIRGGHFIHHKQICAALGCPHAPYAQLDKLLASAEKYISPFTVLHKGEATEIAGLINSDPLMRARCYSKYNMTLVELVRAIESGKETVIFNGTSFVFSDGRKKGYPLNIMLDAVAFVVASKTGKLNGKRVRGSRDGLITEAIKNNPSEYVIISAPDLLTPLVVTDNKAAAMVGPLNEAVYKKLISFDLINKYKMIIRPITEADLR